MSELLQRRVPWLPEQRRDVKDQEIKNATYRQSIFIFLKGVYTCRPRMSVLYACGICEEENVLA